MKYSRIFAYIFRKSPIRHKVIKKTIHAHCKFVPIFDFDLHGAVA